MSQPPPSPPRGHATSLDYHRRLLDDPVRMDAYERAIRALVRPGDVVLDVGAGTGVLAMLAARRGAARVYAVESMPVAGLARALVEANGLGAVVEVIEADIVGLPPSEPVDLILSDFMGRFVVDDAMIDAMEAAGAWLKPEGRCCPGAVRMMVAPVGGMSLRAVDLFEEGMFGLDLSAGGVYALNYCYHAQVHAGALMAAPGVYRNLTPPQMESTFDHALTFEVGRQGRIKALAGWFEAELAPSVVLETGPGHTTHWGQYLFPLPGLEAEPGDRLEVRLWLEGQGFGAQWRWSGALWRGGVAQARFDLESVQRLGRRPAGVSG